MMMFKSASSLHLSTACRRQVLEWQGDNMMSECAPETCAKAPDRASYLLSIEPVLQSQQGGGACLAQLAQGGFSHP